MRQCSNVCFLRNIELLQQKYKTRSGSAARVEVNISRNIIRHSWGHFRAVGILVYPGLYDTTPWVKKTRHVAHVDNFAKNWSILYILSLMCWEQNLMYFWIIRFLKHCSFTRLCSNIC